MISFNRNRKYLRILAVSVFVAAAASAQTESGGYSRLDVTLFGGYQWGRPQGAMKPLSVSVNPPLNAGNRRFGQDAFAGVRLSQEFHNYLGLEEGFTYSFLPVQYTAYGTGARTSLDSRSLRATINPVLHFRPRESRIRPYATVGVAADWFDPAQAALVNVLPDGSQYLRNLSTKVYPHLVYGIGIKVNASRHVGFRIDARDNWGKLPHYGLPDYPATVGSFYSPHGQTLHQVEVSGGIVFRFAHRDPPPPAPVRPPEPGIPTPIAFSVDSVTASAASVCPGASVDVRAATTGVPENATYRWTVNGNPIAATGNTASVNTAGMSGQQNVSVTVESGGVSKSGAASFELKSSGNPTIQVGVSPGSIARGASATIQPVAAGSACGGEVHVSCTSSEGTVNGTTFDSSNIAFDVNDTKPQSKNVSITCTATDSLSAKASANATVAVTESPHARRLDDVVFTKNSARVNNCGKRLLLEEATALLRENPDWTLVLVGHRDEQETGRSAATLDATRAMNAAAVLSAGTGICPSLEPNRIKVSLAGTEQSAQPRPSFCGTSANVKERSGAMVTADDARAQFQRVEVWLVPSGADIPESLKNAAPVEADAVKKLGCPR